VQVYLPRTVEPSAVERLHDVLGMIGADGQATESYLVYDSMKVKDRLICVLKADVTFEL